MNIHLAYFLTALGESLVLYIILSFMERESDEIKPGHILMTIITNFIAAYSGFYLLPWLSSI